MNVRKISSFAYSFSDAAACDPDDVEDFILAVMSAEGISCTLTADHARISVCSNGAVIPVFSLTVDGRIMVCAACDNVLKMRTCGLDAGRIGQIISRLRGRSCVSGTISALRLFSITDDFMFAMASDSALINGTII